MTKHFSSLDAVVVKYTMRIGITYEAGSSDEKIYLQIRNVHTRLKMTIVKKFARG